MRSKYEIKADKELKAEGFHTDYKIRPRFPVHGYSVDYFNLFDLAGYKDGVLRLIAIKGHQGVPGALRKGIEAFSIKKVVKEIWTFRENKTVRKEIIE